MWYSACVTDNYQTANLSLTCTNTNPTLLVNNHLTTLSVQIIYLTPVRPCLVWHATSAQISQLHLPKTRLTDGTPFPVQSDQNHLWTPLRLPYTVNLATAVVNTEPCHSGSNGCTPMAGMGGTRIFELGAARGQGGGHRGTKENCCYRTFNGGKRAAGALAVNDRK